MQARGAVAGACTTAVSGTGSATSAGVSGAAGGAAVAGGSLGALHAANTTAVAIPNIHP